MDFPYGQIVNSTIINDMIDILDYIAPIQIDRFGIQAPPGTLLRLNGEDLTVGKTGLFEIETTITSLEVDGKQSWILDYHIQDNSGGD